MSHPNLDMARASVVDHTGTAYENLRVRVNGSTAMLRRAGRLVTERADVVNVEPLGGQQWSVLFANGEQWSVERKGGCGCGGR